MIIFLIVLFLITACIGYGVVAYVAWHSNSLAEVAWAVVAGLVFVPLHIMAVVIGSDSRDVVCRMVTGV